jgi:hypothetical protein
MSKPSARSSPNSALALRLLLASMVIAASGIDAAFGQPASHPSDAAQPVSSAAQTSTSPPLPEVTVTAPRPPTPQELAGDAVANFVHTHAGPSVVAGQLARWGVGRGPGICPLTQGLSPRLNDFVTARILAVAASVGAPLEPAGQCKHNVYIVFTAEPAKTLDALVKQDPRILGFHYSQDTRKLETLTRPIQGWYLTATRGVRGDQTLDEAEPLLPLETNILNQGKHPAGLPGSRLSSGISSAIVNVVIVADVKKIVGRPIGPVADYLAVLTLSQTFSAEHCGALPSIMDLMLPDCSGREELTGVTAGDLAFLRALYKADLEEILPLERSGIQDGMMREFEGH